MRPSDVEVKTHVPARISRNTNRQSGRPLGSSLELPHSSSDLCEEIPRIIERWPKEPHESAKRLIKEYGC
jgi:hypothetical protein